MENDTIETIKKLMDVIDGHTQTLKTIIDCMAILKDRIEAIENHLTNNKIII